MTWDKMTRYALLTRTGEPMVWDFGSAAKHHRLYCNWLEDANIRAGLNGLRGAIQPEAGLVRTLRKRACVAPPRRGVANMPLGIDIIEPPLSFELEKQKIKIRDGQQVMHDAREIKSYDEILLLSTSAALVDAAYQDIVEALKPGIRENQIVALATKKLSISARTTWSRSTPFPVNVAVHTLTILRIASFARAIKHFSIS